jgi:phage terminase large subunit-like protein
MTLTRKGVVCDRRAAPSGYLSHQKIAGKSKMVAARICQTTEGGYYGGKKATGEKYQRASRSTATSQTGGKVFPKIEQVPYKVYTP